MKSRISSPAAMRLRHFFLIHDIGLGGVLASPAFRRRQEDLGRMATEAMTLVQVEKIRPTAAEQITLEAIPKALERLPGGMSEAKLLPEYKADWGQRGTHGP